MLISYPILPAGADSQTETERLTAMLALTQSDHGLYPVTTGNRWHGGIHLTPGTEPIRAIADGEVVAYRLAPDTKEYPGQGSYDTSFVLIKHDTESGENTQVVFYSLYMHLKPKGLLTDAQRGQLVPFLRNAASSDAAQQAPANTRIWRKDVLGFGGQLYGRPTVHFEVFATEADFQCFWRDRNAVAAGGHGSDDVFGATHFIIPARKSFAATHPRTNARHQIEFPGNAHYPLERGQAGQNAERLQIVVSLGQGRRVATTFRMDAVGRILGPVGAPVPQPDYEYELFRLATALYPDCPSAGFEYLRFGRVLGPDRTTRNENWQLIRYADDAVGYIDLAAASNQVSVLSDADFPLLWQRLQEGEAASPADGIANVQHLGQLLQLPEQPSSASLFAPPEFVARTRDPDVAALLRHFICKHPSEWDSSNIEIRYAELKRPGKPLSDATAWNNFKDHVEKMAFWSQAGLPERSVWHFHPLQFINKYRKCLWLGANEMRQLVPRKVLRGQRSAWLGPFFYERVSGNGALINAHRFSLNKTWRKYQITDHHRLAGFVGNSTQETGWWRTTVEGNGPQLRYAPWYGRGFLQLTNSNGQFTEGSNYQRYFMFRGRPVRGASQNSIDQWRDDVANSNYDAADSAGAYWSWNIANREADNHTVNSRREITLAHNSQMLPGQRFSVYENTSFRRIACLINLPSDINRNDPRLNGLVDRFSGYANAQVVLLDSPSFPDVHGQSQPIPQDFDPRRP